jgi:V8-like Glu-specific endopeptidase
LVVLAAVPALIGVTAPAAVAAPKVPVEAGTQSAYTHLTPDVAALAGDPETALERYWTPERMAAAKPADEGVSSMGVQQAAQTSALGEITAQGTAPVTTESSLPDVTIMSGSNGTSWPHRHDWVALTNGKVFFDKSSTDRGWMCSGVVVTSEARNTVFTAGHCVHDGSGSRWYNGNWTFVPDYYNGDRPKGTWQARQLWSLNGWMNNSDRAYDIGAAVMFPLNGKKLVDVTGSQGIRINGPQTPYVYHFGFPANSPFNGEDLINCDGQTSKPNNLKLACNMQGGASGGAWLADFNGNAGYTVSVNSYHVGNDLTQIYGPYFGDGAYNLYQSVRNLS